MASTAPPFRLSVLDQSPISQGSSGAQALANTLDLARLADRLGYHRYWVAEHHGGPMLAGPSPEALIGPIAAATSAHPRGQRRRDAAALQPAEGGRDVQRAGGAVPGTHRPRAGARGGHRSDDDVSPCSATAARPRPTTSPSSWRSCSAISTTACQRTIRSRAWRGRCPGARTSPSRGCWAPRRRARCGPPSSAWRTRSRTSSIPQARRSRRCIASASPSTSTPRRSRARRSACG